MARHRSRPTGRRLRGWLLLLVAGALVVAIVAVLSGRGASSGSGAPATSSSGGSRSPSPAMASCATGAQQPSSPVSPATGPAAGKSTAFADEFDTLAVGPGETWGSTTSAYAQGNRNPKDHKLDSTTPSAMQVSGGVLTMTATPRSDRYWDTGLLTTEPSATGGNGFRVQAGDFLVTRVRLPGGNTGGWPALWTWLDGNGELDAFEWHSDNPNLLELSNRIRPAATYHTDKSLVAPCSWVWIGVQLGADDDTWFVGADLTSMQPVFDDHNGIGGTRPYIITNLSVADGTSHEAPSGSTPITYAVDSLRVYR